MQETKKTQNHVDEKAPLNEGSRLRIPALELEGITKTFGSVIANDHISLFIYRGEILSVLGENGSGKSTLMNIIDGIYYPDAGTMRVNGKEVQIHSPRDAFAHRIGMIHQHFKLVDVFSATENIVLGLNDGKFNLKKAADRIREIGAQYGFRLDPDKKIYDMSVSEKQMVEIIKVLYRGADLLILDEPTAVLTPQEIRSLFSILRRMRDDGKAVVIITHKLQEVLELSDRIAVLRKGKLTGTVNTRDTDETQLTEMMVGEKMDLNIRRAEPQGEEARLKVRHLDIRRGNRDVIRNVSFTVRSGEIFGIAGISGNGQKELLESIAGLQKVEHGSIEYVNPETGEKEMLLGKTPDAIRAMGIRLSFVPEDRLGMGLVGNMDMTDNMLLRSYDLSHHMILNRKDPKQLAEEIIRKLNIVTPSVNTPIRQLSGGNVQKVLVGREMASSPTLLMVAYPVRGLDINSSYQIYHLLNEEKEQGVAVVYVGEDLDVMVSLCDRIMVLADGTVSGIVDARNTTKEEIGLLMTQNRTFLNTSEAEEERREEWK
ncbi:ABC transporter ATP-binding protein [Peptoniphilaceae bacterium SGI.137]|nr:ABC transporter ATP-binding protein [Peptoniphilaceae bacterium]MDY4196514.1 ABC transporter ATP-binding protein [Peptoniphilaceae bacterium]